MSHGEGAAPAANPGQLPGPLGQDGAGGQDWSVLPQPSFSQQAPAQPALYGGWRGAASHGCTPGSHAARGSGFRLKMASSFHPWPQGQPVLRRGSKGFSLSHGKAHRTRHPGELHAVSFLTGSVGKTIRRGGCAPWPCSRASHPRAGKSLEPPEGNVYGTAPGRRQLPAHSQHLCRHKGLRNIPLPAGASPALHVLLFGG